MKLQVEATTNGEEAIAAWEKYGPGHFQAGMFDHRTFSDSLEFLGANSTFQICLYAMASKPLDAYEPLRWNADTTPDCRVSTSFVVFS